MKPFFIKISNFWAWADNLGSLILGHLGYFMPIYQRTFWFSGSLVPCPCFPLFNHYFYNKLSKPLYSHLKYLFGIGIGIWACKELGIQPSCVRSPWIIGWYIKLTTVIIYDCICMFSYNNLFYKVNRCFILFHEPSQHCSQVHTQVCNVYVSIRVRSIFEFQVGHSNQSTT